jgi:hypothetical protein
MTTIEFSTLEPFVDLPFKPVPAKKALPDWLKLMPAVSLNGAPTAKKCPPFVDTFGMGYIVPTWQEFNLIPTDGVYSFRAGVTHIYNPYEQSKPVCSYQFPEQYKDTPLDGYQVIKIQTPWIIKTPPNTSVLILPPLGGTDLPFEAIPAIIDTDTYHMPFGFTCKIKYDPSKSYNIQPGQPIAQVIPFRRESWKMTLTVTTMLDAAKVSNKLRSYIMSGYKKLFWKKKDYN